MEEREVREVREMLLSVLLAGLCFFFRNNVRLFLYIFFRLSGSVLFYFCRKKKFAIMFAQMLCDMYIHCDSQF